MMKYRTLFLFSMILLFTACDKKETAVFPYEFDTDQFIITESAKEYFNAALSDLIVFKKDGTYKRTEFTGSRYYLNKELGYENEDLLFTLNIKGNWEYDENGLKLNDEAIEDYKCKTVWGEEVDVDVSFDRLPLGRSEWFKGRAICKEMDGILIVDEYSSI